MAAISRAKTENYLTDYIPRVAANEMARFLKIADIDDHLFLTATLTPEKKERYERAREVLLAPAQLRQRTDHLSHDINVTGFKSHLSLRSKHYHGTRRMIWQPAPVIGRAV